MQESCHPFDARRQLMCEDHTGPRESWTLSSLVTDMRDALRERFEPVGERGDPLKRFNAASRELTRRGLDADSIVRYGMVVEVLGPMLTVLLIDLILPDGNADSGLRVSGVDLDGWRTLLGVPAGELTSHSEITSTLEKTTTSIFGPLLNWVGTAAIGALVNLSLPDTKDFWKCPPPPRDFRVLAYQYRWLVERVTETYVKAWSTASLILEYRYRQNIEPMSFPAFVWETRDLDLDEVSREIAHRTSAEWNPSPNAPPNSEFLLQQMTTHARSLLVAGQRAAAAALFEFAAQQWPDDASAQNNLGFCLVLDQPDRALRHLGLAARMGYEPMPINAYNRMCCYVALNQERHALETAEEFWRQRGDLVQNQDRAIVWILNEEGQWSLDRKARPWSVLVGLAISIAQRQGWQEEEDRWRPRLPPPAAEEAPGEEMA
ncbi:hypothetical protein [Nonomuraea cavernae]|uniref:hypothetical protein n=1 Tax=Nonomuraea cavernae TaxID=2045107 RepID=UPI0033F4DEAC